MAEASTNKEARREQQDAEQLVRAMFDAAYAGDRPSFERCWADDAVWYNLPLMPVRGKQSILKWWQPVLDKPGSFRAELLSVAVSGNIVHTERVDHMEIRGLTIKAPVAGIFEVRGGQIISNREYWDLLSIGLGTLRAPFARLLRPSAAARTPSAT